MNSIFGKVFKVAFFAALIVVFIGCNYQSQSAVNAVEPTKRTAWIAYWELDAGEKDLQRVGKKLDKLAFFGAYFDKNNRLFIPQELSDKKNELSKAKGKYETYLTFINDKQNSNGTIILKDTEILRRIFADDASMDKHIDEIVALTLQGGYDGIEIDYERVWKDDEAGQSFASFANKLYLKTIKNNLKLRFVLEPGMPFSAASYFAEGPEYVVMLYNLYGLHSGPGPKANKDFILKTLARMKPLPGEKSVALATGGCVWGDNGEKRFLTEVEAKTLAVTMGSETKRDDNSQCVVFKYTDRGIKYQVWYADVETLNYWISIVKEQGINNISLWRLGGNVDINKIL